MPDDPPPDPITKSWFKARLADAYEATSITDDAVDKVLADLSGTDRDQLLTQYARQTLINMIRSRAEITGVSETQMSLLSLGQSLSDVHVEHADGHVVQKAWHVATINEHDHHLLNKQQDHLKKAGVCERQRARLNATAEENLMPRDRPLGPIVFADLRCCICDDLLYRMDDPPVKAHDFPVAGNSGRNTVQWAHNSCNQSEGTR